jgi:hypothetical protein
MSLFSFKPEARSLLSKIGKPRLFLFFGAIVVLILGNTLAANISLNSGGNVEFGQGVALTTACDDDVTVTPYSTFVNEEGAGDFMFTSISVTGISEDCDGKIFTIKAFEEGSDNPLNLYITGGSTTYNSVEVSYTMSGDEGTFSLVDAGLLSDDIIDRERDDGSDSDGFTVNLFTEDVPSSEAVASARDVDRITIESRDGDVTDPDAEISLLAAGERLIVDAETPLNTPTLHNGTYWYNTPGASRGFSKDSSINQSSCDYANPLSNQTDAEFRLCWHRQLGLWMSDGFRMGTIENGLNRFIFTANSLPAYYPSGPQRNVLISTITSGGWEMCYGGSYESTVSDSDVSACSGNYVLFYAILDSELGLG